MLAGVNIYEQISCKSDTCIYLMCKETQLTKMIITQASQCYSGRINNNRYDRGASLSDCNKIIQRYCINGVWNCIILFWPLLSREFLQHLKNTLCVYTRNKSALYIWFSDIRAYSLSVSHDLVIKKAKQFGDKVSVTDFLYSRGWLRQKKRHGSRLHKARGEAGSV